MAEKFVATTGVDSPLRGAIDLPYLTMPYAKTQISGADTISVRGGSYGATVLSNLVSGTSDAQRTMIRAYQNEPVTVNNSGNVAFLRNDTPSRYITIQGIEVVGGHALLQLSAFNPGDHHHISVISCTARSMNPGIAVEASASADCEILNSLLHDNGANGLEHGVYLAKNCQRWLIKSNTVYNISGYGLHLFDDTGSPPSTCKLLANRIYRCGKAGVIAYGPDHLIANQLCYLNGTNGILLRGVSNALVDTNTTWRNGQGGPLLVFGDGDRGIVLESGNGIAKGNIVWEDGQIGGLTIGAGNIVGTDPLFVDPNNGDFSVRHGSPAILACPSLAADGYSDDFYGRTRP